MRRLAQGLIFGLIGILICCIAFNVLQSTTYFGFIGGKDLFGDLSGYDPFHIKRIRTIRCIFIIFLVIFTITGCFIEDFISWSGKRKKA